MSSSIGMMRFPTEWKNKKCSVPNHQPEMVNFMEHPNQKGLNPMNMDDDLRGSHMSGNLLFNRSEFQSLLET